jgi:hypothetical protein
MSVALIGGCVVTLLVSWSLMDDPRCGPVARCLISLAAALIVWTLITSTGWFS